MWLGWTDSGSGLIALLTVRIRSLICYEDRSSVHSYWRLRQAIDLGGRDSIFLKTLAPFDRRHLSNAFLGEFAHAIAFHSV